MKLPRPLDPVEIRILGALLEKAQTTPDYYPMTVNALLAACNQKNNREPVMQLSEAEVWDGLDRLRQEVLVWRSEGARSERWSESITRRLGLQGDTGRKALLTLLLLRGAQTPGELRGRSERMHAFGGVDEVEAELCEMAAGEEPLVVELPRRPGQKETRWRHLLGGPLEADADDAGDFEATAEPAPPRPRAAAPAADPGLAARVEALEEQVAALAAELAALKERLGED